MYSVLCTNVETLKDRGLEAKTHEISIAVLEADLDNGVKEPIFYAFRSGRIYNPHDGFTPNTPRGHKITGVLVEEYYTQVATARQEYNKKLKKRANSGNSSELEKEIAQKNAEIFKREQRLKDIEKELEEMKKRSSENKVVRHPEFDTVVTILEEGVAVYMYGNAGTGKSALAKQIADHMGLDFYPASTITQEFKLTGFKDANGLYHNTNFYRAMKDGGLFFLDEMDSSASEVMVGINGALANGYFDFPHGTVEQHKDFRVLSAGNTIGHGSDRGFTGRQALDISTLDRFMALEIEYSEDIDHAVAKDDQELVEFAHALRRSSEENDILIVMSYRALDRIVKFKDKFDLVKLLKMALIKGLRSEDMEMLALNMEIDKKNKYYQAFLKAL